ncbi:hypothetical protein AB0J83_48220 [Actinoplanes sp. NPDC049596]|uniref:hypothetical protein n=1 Tax=unclassified Actinoplanes TaxID=2626549 RepID=UPI0034287749
MRNMLQVVGGVAAAGVIAASATALTGAGLVRTGTGADQWIGGKVVQAVNGASLDAVTYTFQDDAKQQLTGFNLTLTGAASKTIVLKPVGTPGTLTTAVEWVCTGTGVGSSTWDGTAKTITVVGGVGTGTLACITADSGHLAAGYQNNLSSLEVTVS